MTDISQVLEQRQAAHGDFASHAVLSQSLKVIMRSSPHWDALDADMQEALDMIQHKIARALNGNPRHIDHWTDIQGYARLVERRLEGEETL